MAFPRQGLSRVIGGTLAAVIALQPVAGFGQPDPSVEAGMSVIQQRKCGGCHTIPGVPDASGTFGPNLGPTDTLPPLSGRDPIAGEVPNTSPDDLAAWLLDPPSLKPGTLMPRLGLSPDEAAAAAAYLYAIQPDGSVAGLGETD